MANVGVLIAFSALGTFICAKARVPGGAVVFALIGLVLFVSTPAGSGLPSVVTGFFDAVDDSATLILTNEEPTEAVG